jgi:hypothetical protein
LVRPSCEVRQPAGGMTTRGVSPPAVNAPWRWSRAVEGVRSAATATPPQGAGPRRPVARAGRPVGPTLGHFGTKRIRSPRSGQTGPAAQHTSPRSCGDARSDRPGRPRAVRPAGSDQAEQHQHGMVQAVKIAQLNAYAAGC